MRLCCNNVNTVYESCVGSDCSVFSMVMAEGKSCSLVWKCLPEGRRSNSAWPGWDGSWRIFFVFLRLRELCSSSSEGKGWLTILWVTCITLWSYFLYATVQLCYTVLHLARYAIKNQLQVRVFENISVHPDEAVLPLARFWLSLCCLKLFCKVGCGRDQNSYQWSDWPEVWFNPVWGWFFSLTLFSRFKHQNFYVSICL